MADHLILIRHGDIDPEWQGRYLGRTDVPLSGEGRRQAARLAGAIPSGRSVSCFTSPLRRAVETAGIALAGMGLAAEADTELREVDFGDWEGLSFAQISTLDAEGVRRWDSWDAHFAFPGGERLRDFLGRVGRVAQRLASVRTETVVVFTHGGIVRSLICHYLGLESRNYLLFDVAPASVTTIRLFDGRGVLARLNDCCHLKGD